MGLSGFFKKKDESLVSGDAEKGRHVPLPPQKPSNDKPTTPPSLSKKDARSIPAPSKPSAPSPPKLPEDTISSEAPESTPATIPSLSAPALSEPVAPAESIPVQGPPTEAPEHMNMDEIKQAFSQPAPTAEQPAVSTSEPEIVGPLGPGQSSISKAVREPTQPKPDFHDDDSPLDLPPIEGVGEDEDLHQPEEHDTLDWAALEEEHKEELDAIQEETEAEADKIESDLEKDVKSDLTKDPETQDSDETHISQELDEKIDETPIEPPEKPQTVKTEKGELFVKGENYKDLYYSVSEMKTGVREMESALQNYSSSSQEQDHHFQKFSDGLNHIQEKLMEMDSKLFER